MVIFMGVAGAGKSMQGKLLADKMGLPWLSTGEFLRMLVSGQERKDMQVGKLLDDQEIIGLVRKIFSVVDTDHEFVLDGFPRTIAQADWLINQIKHGQLRLTAILNIRASEKVIRKRLLGRGRNDDNEGAINKRYKEYEATTLPLINQFREAGLKVVDIDGDLDPDNVHQAIMQVLQGTD